MANKSTAKRPKPSTENAHDLFSISTVVPDGESDRGLLPSASHWDLEQDYEQRPRKKRKSDQEDTRLPIKTAEGRVEPSRLPARVYVQHTEDEEDLPDVDAAVETVEPESLEPKIPLRQQIIEAKEELARIAGLLREDPEEHAGSFRGLAQFASSSNVTIKKLALATQLAVYQDVIPGYRIRPLGEDDGTVKVSKDVRRLRTYEQALVGGYQGYVRDLARLSKAGREGSSEDAQALARVAIACACALVTAVPHFNFRGELLQILVDRLGGRRIDQDFTKCRSTLETLFQDDDDGPPSLDAAGQLTKMIKARHYRVDESVLNTFLQLRLLSEFSSKGSYSRIDKAETPRTGKGALGKKGREFRTKKQRKLEKERRAVEVEMREADATVSHEERDRMQAETLKLVFTTYFRTLKAGVPHLMGAVLEGLAKYAHLINQDFFGDLLEALKDLIRRSEAEHGEEEEQTGETKVEKTDEAESESGTDRNPARESLLCTITAFALLEGQSSTTSKSLNLDLSFFVSHLYRTLYPLCLDPDLERREGGGLHLPDPSGNTTVGGREGDGGHAPTVNHSTQSTLLVRCLRSAVLPLSASISHTSSGPRASSKASTNTPPTRILAFTKTLLTTSLQTPAKTSTALLTLLASLTTRHKRLVGRMWHTDLRKGDGVWDPLGGSVDAANPAAATIWEGELLRCHYDPVVRKAQALLEERATEI
ncbi:MAG: hypothetical protein M1838_002783 [Thelocarpon superellum]|nr:MAG: hypothetical protein M1838_002783 [Thelocarpon superellum]